MTFTVCLGCGDIRTEGSWYQCSTCGYSPPDDETLTKQLLARDEQETPALLEIARKVKAGERVEFDPMHMQMNQMTYERVRQMEAMGNAMSQRKCPDCASPIEYFEEGMSCGWRCSQCPWGLMTTNPRAFER